MKLKFKKLKLPVMLLALAVSITGCKKNDEIEIINGDNWGIQSDDNNPIINGMVGDIGFKFCLLNEDSIHANVFKEGENFYFYFVIENLSEEEITIEGKSFSHNLFLVYDEEAGNLIGKPFSGVFCHRVLCYRSLCCAIINPCCCFAWVWRYPYRICLWNLFHVGCFYAIHITKTRCGNDCRTYDRFNSSVDGQRFFIHRYRIGACTGAWGGINLFLI